MVFKGILTVFGGMLKVFWIFRGVAFLVGVSWDGAGTVDVASSPEIVCCGVRTDMAPSGPGMGWYGTQGPGPGPSQLGRFESELLWEGPSVSEGKHIDRKRAPSGLRPDPERATHMPPS